MNEPRDLFTAVEVAESKRRAERGADQAVEHADAADEGWSREALERVRQYAMREKRFRLEVVRELAEADGFPVPPSRRAWGAVVVRAARIGYIRKVGYTMSVQKHANATPVTLWESLIV